MEDCDCDWTSLPPTVMEALAPLLRGTMADVTCSALKDALRGAVRPNLGTRAGLHELGFRLRLSPAAAARVALLRLRASAHSPAAQADAEDMRGMIAQWFKHNKDTWLAALRDIAGLDVDGGTLAFLDFCHAAGPQARDNPTVRRTLADAVMVSAKHGTLPAEFVRGRYVPLPWLPDKRRHFFLAHHVSELVDSCLPPEARPPREPPDALSGFTMALQALNPRLAVAIATNSGFGPDDGDAAMLIVESTLGSLGHNRVDTAAEHCPVQPGGPVGFCFCSKARAIEPGDLLEPLLAHLPFMRVFPPPVAHSGLRRLLAGSRFEFSRPKDAVEARADLLARGLVDRVSAVRPAAEISDDEAARVAQLLAQDPRRNPHRYIPGLSGPYMRAKGVSVRLPALCHARPPTRLFRALCRYGLVDPSVALAYSRAVLNYSEEPDGFDLRRAAAHVLDIAAIGGQKLSPMGVQLLFDHGVSNLLGTGRAMPPAEHEDADEYDVDWHSLCRAFAACLETPMRGEEYDSAPALHAWLSLASERLRSARSAAAMLDTLRDAVLVTLPPPRAEAALGDLTSPQAASDALLGLVARRR